MESVFRRSSFSVISSFTATELTWLGNRWGEVQRGGDVQGRIGMVPSRGRYMGEKVDAVAKFVECNGIKMRKLLG